MLQLLILYKTPLCNVYESCIDFACALIFREERGAESVFILVGYTVPFLAHLFEFIFMPSGMHEYRKLLKLVASLLLRTSLL